MAVPNLEDRWRRVIQIIEITEMQWKDRIRNKVSEENQLKVDKEFEAIKRLVEGRTQTIECLGAFQHWWNNFNLHLADLALTAGLNISVHTGLNS